MRPDTVQKFRDSETFYSWSTLRSDLNWKRTLCSIIKYRLQL